MRLLHVVDIVQPAVPRLAWEFPAIDYTRLLTNMRGGAFERCSHCRKSSMDGCILRSMWDSSSTRSCGMPPN